jgi:peptidylprolyl isomerase
MKTAFRFPVVFLISLFMASFAFTAEDFIIKEPGIRYLDLEMGSGRNAEKGMIAVIHFTAWLEDQGRTGRKIFDSRDHEKPIAFKIGTDNVIKGWNIGVVGMKAGGKRRLMIDSELAYGAEGSGDIIPPDANMIYEIELIEIKD